VEHVLSMDLIPKVIIVMISIQFASGKVTILKH